MKIVELVLLPSLLLMSGCHLPMAKRESSIESQTPQHQPHSQPQVNNPVTPIESLKTQNAPQPISMIQQVGFHQSCSCCGPMRGNSAHCIPTSDVCSTDCNVPTHGYAMASPAGWNAYGVDPNEFLCDGGDHDPKAILQRNDELAGLNAEDTVVHYTTEAGDIHVQPSNRVCVYAPRFASVRKITGAVSGGRAIGAAGFDRPVGAGGIQYDQPRLEMTDTTELAHADVTRRVDAMRDRNRGVRIEGILQPEMAEDILALVAGLSVTEMAQLQENQLALLQEASTAAITWAIDESVEVAVKDLKPPTITRDQRVEGLTVYEFPEAGRLQILKLADRAHAQPGDIVTFAIQVQNVGDSPVESVVLTDNLTTRLEYVEESQTASGGARFETSLNEAESLKLQWTLTDKLRVGESVTIRFKCRVR